MPEAVRVPDPRGIGCCLEQARCAEQTSVVRLTMPLIARLYNAFTTMWPIFITFTTNSLKPIVSIKSITRALSPFRLLPRINRPDHTIVISVPTSATNKSTGSVFAARQTEAVCCGVSNNGAALTSRIKETARNEEITSACIRHEYLRGVRCTVRGRRSRQRPRLFSKNLASGVPGLETITDSSLVNPWDISFPNGGVPSEFRTRAQIWPRFIR